MITNRIYNIGEYDLYKQNEEVLKIVGVDVEQPGPDSKQDFEGIEITFGAKVILKPSFGVTLKEIKSRFAGIQASSIRLLNST